MKGLDQDFKENKVEISIEKQQKKELRLIASQRKIKGHILFEYNAVTKELCKGEFKKTTYHLKSLSSSEHNFTENHRVIVRDNCVYFQALNLENAKKKLRRQGLPFIIPAKNSTKSPAYNNIENS